MSEESDRMMVLLEELATLKEAKGQEKTSVADRRERRKEISREMKELARQKQKSTK